MPYSLLLNLIGLLLLTTACASPLTERVPLSDHTAAGDRYQGIRLLGTLRLPAADINGLKVEGLSALAWDQDEQRLYALSDLGRLFHLKVRFDDGLLAAVEFVDAYPLQGSDGRSLGKAWTDSEGLTLLDSDDGTSGNSRLVISFETRPRLVTYTPDGRWLANLDLPKPLNNRNFYRDGNRALEAVTLHPDYGLLVAPERPPGNGHGEQLPIYALDGRHWSYPLYPAANSSLVAMEALPDRSLLTLERAFNGLTRPLIISLRRTRLPDSSTEPLTVEDLAVFDTTQGWLLDNFEGLTRLQDRQFCMISDDNQQFLQSTLLVCFEQIR